MSEAPYRDGAKAYRGAGLGQAIPVHPTKEHQPRGGLIGRGARRHGDTPRPEEKEWRQRHGDWNLGIHLAAGVISLDVDEAEELLAEIAHRNLPPLPASDYSTARGAKSTRRQILYRLPDGTEWDADGRIPGAPSPGEIIDADHRFVRAWPSVHVKTGGTYQWYAAPSSGDALGKGNRLDAPPSAGSLATLLPEHVAWLQGAQRRSKAHSAISGTLEDLLAGLDGSPKYGKTLRELVEAIPTAGLGNGDMNAFFGPLVRAAWGAKGGRAAIEDGVDRYADGYPRKYRKAAWHSIETVARDHATEREARTTLEAPAAVRKKTKKHEPKKRPKKKGKKAKAGKKRGALAHDEYTPRGSTSSATTPAKPAIVAEEILADEILPPILFWRDQWYLYRDTHWQAVPDRACIDLLYLALKDARFISGKGEDGKPKMTDWAPNRARCAEVLRAIQTTVTLPDETMWPCRIDGRGAKPLVPMRNGLLDPRTQKLHPRSYRHFSLQHIPADFEPDAPAPEKWLAFLEQLWGDDPEQIALLQEWMGYVVSGDTDMQKFLSITGPTRSGKGTIAHILRRLVGEQQAVGKSLQSLGESFGLQSLRGATLAVFADARAIDAVGMRIAAQRILEITGEDHLEINRKHISAVTEQIRARVVLLGNSLPSFYDDSGVIADRMLHLHMTQSFLGREDRKLRGKLERELGGILNWSLEGYRRLREQGRFTEPASSAEGREAVRRGAAPILDYIEEQCVTGDELTVLRADLWADYRRWCGEHDIRTGGVAVFKRALTAVGIHAYQPKLADGTRPRLYRGIALAAEESPEQRAKRIWGATSIDAETGES